MGRSGNSEHKEKSQEEVEKRIVKLLLSYIQVKEELEKLFTDNGIGKDKQVVCYCSSGMRASHTFIALKIAGFQNVRLYDGSIIDWASRRLPIEY